MRTVGSDGAWTTDDTNTERLADYNSAPLLLQPDLRVLDFRTFHQVMGLAQLAGSPMPQVWGVAWMLFVLLWPLHDVSCLVMVVMNSFVLPCLMMYGL